jgi:hypothetical protein
MKSASVCYCCTYCPEECISLLLLYILSKLFHFRCHEYCASQALIGRKNAGRQAAMKSGCQNYVIEMKILCSWQFAIKLSNIKIHNKG